MEREDQVGAQARDGGVSAGQAALEKIKGMCWEISLGIQSKPLPKKLRTSWDPGYTFWNQVVEALDSRSLLLQAVTSIESFNLSVPQFPLVKGSQK